MSKWLIVMVGFLAAASSARAQDETIKEVTPAYVEAFIKDVMKVVNAKKTAYPDENRIYYATPPQYFDVEFRTGPKKAIRFVAEFNNKVIASAEKLNEWNLRETNSSRASLKGKQVVLAGSIECNAGLTDIQLKSFYDKLVREKTDFFNFLTAPKQEETEGEVFRQGFPNDENLQGQVDLSKHDTGWEIEWDFIPVESNHVKSKLQLFRIKKATFKWKDSAGKEKSLVVLRNLYLAEAFTQYDDKLTCFLDIAKVGTVNLKASETYLGPSCIGVGSVLPAKNPLFANKVHKELHYDGLRWVRVYDGDRARKGEKLTLWSGIKSGNYAYLIEYVFTDDGRIVSRLGFTAHNFYDRAAKLTKGSPYGFRLNEEDVHPHIGCWRFEFDLGEPNAGPGGPELSLVRRVFDKEKEFKPYVDERGKLIPIKKGGFKVESVPFPGDGNEETQEGKAKWVAKEFTTLRARSSEVTNKNGKPIAYDLISTRTGTAADLMELHQAAGSNIDFINYDFWVTKTPKEYRHYHEVPKLAKNQVIKKGESSTVWHSVPALHVPRDEDFGPGGVNARAGVALTAWVEFTLRPRDLFDSTPLYGSGQK